MSIATRLQPWARSLFGRVPALAAQLEQGFRISNTVQPSVDLADAAGDMIGTPTFAVASIIAAAQVANTSSIGVSTNAPGGAVITSLAIDGSATTATALTFATGVISPPTVFGDQWGGRQFDELVPHPNGGKEPSPFGRLQLAAVSGTAVPSQTVARVGSMLVAAGNVPPLLHDPRGLFFVPPSNGEASLIITTGGANEAVGATITARLIPFQPPWQTRQG